MIYESWVGEGGEWKSAWKANANNACSTEKVSIVMVIANVRCHFQTMTNARSFLDISMRALPWMRQ